MWARGHLRLARRARALALALALALACGAVGACSAGDERRSGEAQDADDEARSAAPPPESGSAASAEARRPPLQAIVLISIDTLRADHLGFYGHSRPTSPVLDALALESVVFEDASATSPWTLPSHASMLTGFYPLAHGVMTSDEKLPRRIPTVAALLAAGGFETAAVVNSTWLKRDNFELTRDFAEYLFVPNADEGRRAPSTWVTDQAIDWLRNLGSRRRFVFMHYVDVHSDYASLPAYEKLFVTPYSGPADGTTWQLKLAGLTEGHIEGCKREYDPAICAFGSADKPRSHIIDESVEKPYFDADDIRHMEELYDAGVRQIDTELGRFFAWLRQEGLMEKTLLIVTSDHGEEFMDHGRVDHFLTTYQETLRVPLLLRGPGLPRGVRIAQPVSLVDLVPTILRQANVHVPADLDGFDLAPLWRGGESGAFEARYLYGEAAGGLQHDLRMKGVYPLYRSVRRGRYKLVTDSGTGSHALYDLQVDPREQVDISRQEPAITAELLEELRRRPSGSARSISDENRVDLSPEDVDALRALGYLP